MAFIEGARVEDGWLRIPFTGHDLSVIEISVGTTGPGTWQPAFMDTMVDGSRVVQVRPPDFSMTPGVDLSVWVRINQGAPALVGKIVEVASQPLGRRRR